MASSGLNRARGRPPAHITFGLLLVVGLAGLLMWRRPAPVASVVPSAISTGTLLDEEAQLMLGAQHALANGDTDHAFSLLYEQATKFPKGKLAEPRELTHMRALCRAGKPAEARDEAANFLRQHGDSPLAAEVKTVCPPSP